MSSDSNRGTSANDPRLSALGDEVGSDVCGCTRAFDVPLHPSHVLGIDFSTKALDLVFLSENTDEPRWVRVALSGTWKAARDASQFDWARELEEAGVYLLAIEQPYGAGQTSIAALHRVQGAILASLPLNFDDDQIWLMHPSEWKAAAGLKGNASTQKEPGRSQLLQWACSVGAGEDWPVDAAAALAMAWTAREINAEAIGGKAA